MLAKINRTYPGIFDEFFGRDSYPVHYNRYGFKSLPAVNITEGDNEYTIEVAAPGLDRKDFKLRTAGLVVRGKIDNMYRFLLLRARQYREDAIKIAAVRLKALTKTTKDAGNLDIWTDEGNGATTGDASAGTVRTTGQLEVYSYGMLLL